jgi:alkanesulfonate monooxygenase SsuD/methylene tetrahydromethanopterin reductase-like flavin-dependent oxidoreductase (luciferase family)
MPQQLPAVSLVAVPGRRKATLEVAREIDRLGFQGIYAPSMFGNMSLCEALAHSTERMFFATSIAPIYARTVSEFAQSAAFMHEVSGGRFRFGIGVSHERTHIRMGVTPGKPLGDIRTFVENYRSQEGLGDLAPVIVATLRKRMIALAGEIGDGMVFANGSRSHMADSLAALPAEKRDDPNFFIGNMVPTCISDDVEAAKAVNRKTLTSYAMLPNYRNYWKEAGYVEEMEAIEKAISEDRLTDIPSYLSDRWLADCTLFGPAAQVRDGLEAWYAAGVRTPIIVPSSAAGNQMKAIEEMFATFTG